jgi:7-carboxy-7-deazaguanine synthase
MARLRLTEIFHSLQGESATVGWRTAFVRLTGCPLRCGYCDTAYAFKGGDWWQIEDVLEEVSRYEVRHVTVTGGEPLAQPECLNLLTVLCDAGYRVSLETSGAIDISPVDTRVARVMDLKTPGSGELDKNLYANIEQLRPSDQVKFVITDEADYRWSCEQLERWGLTKRCEVLFSPVAGALPPAQLAGWILRDRLDLRFQLQLHKILWGDQPGR